MSPVIAFDIAIVAQKVKVQLLYNGRHAKSEKKWVGGVGWFSSRSGWLLELLKELISVQEGGIESPKTTFFQDKPWYNWKRISKKCKIAK